MCSCQHCDKKQPDRQNNIIVSYFTIAQQSNQQLERNVLFNDALNTFYLRLYGVRHMVKDYSDSEKGKPAAAT